MKIKSLMITLLALILVLPSLAGAAVGKLTSMEGKIDITSPGKAAKPANPGDSLNVGDIIRSKSKSRCEITFADGNILRLAENTRLKITEYMFEKDKRSEILNLFRGKIQSLVQRVTGATSPEKAGRYEIHTPTAVAGVRGTNFFAYHQRGVSGAVFKEGTGYGYSINRPQEIRTINPGQAMMVTNPDLPPIIRLATLLELEQHQKETAPGEGGKSEGGREALTDLIAAVSDTPSDVFSPPPPPPAPPRPLIVEIPFEKQNDTSPAISFTAKPSLLTNNAEAAFTIVSTEAGTTYSYSTDGVNYTNVTGSTINLSGLSEGQYTIYVKGTDAAGNSSAPISYTWTTDYTAPAVTLSGTPTSITKEATANIGVTASEQATFTYTLNGVTVNSPNLTNLPEGNNTFTVKATDLAGNESTTTYTWTTDYTTLTGTIYAPALPALFDHTIDNGTITGYATDIRVEGTTTDANPVDAAAGFAKGTTSDGNAFAGYVMCLPTSSGNWVMLMRSIYVTGSGAGFLYGPLSGTFSGNTFAGTGDPLTQSPILGATTLAPANLVDSMEYWTGTFFLPLLGEITVNEDLTLSINSGVTDSDLRGIVLDDGKKLGVWGVTTSSGSFYNWSGSTTLSGYFGDSLPITYHMHGLISGSGPLGMGAGEVTLSGELDYMGTHYTGKTKLAYSGYADGSGGYRSIGAGGMTLDPLAWSGIVDYDYNDQGLYSVVNTGEISYINYDGDTFGGLAGGLTAPWSSGTYTLTYMGEYTPSQGTGPYIWTAPLYSYNFDNTTKTTYDGGAFFGLTSGVWLGNAPDNTIDARIYSIYVSPAGKAGILKGALTGNYYPAISMYQVDGSWAPTELATGLTPANVTDIISSSPSLAMDDTIGSATVSGSFPIEASINQATGSPSYEARTYRIAGQGWGIFQAIMGGDYIAPTSDTWSLSTDYDKTDEVATGTETIGSQWSANKILGTTYGFGADITGAAPSTWIAAGETIGSFDPNVQTWQAVQAAVYLDTDTFLTLAQTDAGRATLQQLNIPAIEVGKATLSGSYIGSGSISVTMENVTFFANSTGGAPRIWATNGVTGSYDSAYGYAGQTAALSGNGLTANFNVKTWDTAGGKWLSTVTDGTGTYIGTGSMSGSGVTFRGAGAGTINTGASTISGAAAGTAK